MLYKYDKQGRLVARNGQPFEGLPLAANHIGDIDVWNGEIYAGIETFDDGKGENIQVAVYDAGDLTWKRSIDWEPASGQVEVCGLAVDRDRNMVWMADWVDGRYLYGYDLATGKYVRKVHLRRCRSGSKGYIWPAGRCSFRPTTAMPTWTSRTTSILPTCATGKAMLRCCRSA